MIATIKVTECLIYLVRTLMAFDVDADGYVIYVHNGERVLVGDKEPKPIIVYQERITDTSAHILNPFAEGLGTPPATGWLYRQLRLALFSRMAAIFEAVVKLALEQKGDGKKEGTSHAPAVLLNLAALIVDQVDEKMYEQVPVLFDPRKNGDDLIAVAYNSRNQRSILTFQLTDNHKWVTDLGLRKKDVAAFDTLARAILNLKPTEKAAEAFIVNAQPNVASKLTTQLTVFFNVYQRFNLILDAVSQADALDLGVWKSHLDNMAEYYANAKHMVPLSEPEKKTQPGMVPPTNAPAMPGQVYVPPPVTAATPTAGAATLVPGPVYADGRQGPALVAPAAVPGPVYTQPQTMMGYPQQQMGMGYGQPQMGGYPMMGGYPQMGYQQAAYNPIPTGTMGLAVGQPMAFGTYPVNTYGYAPNQPMYVAG